MIKTIYLMNICNYLSQTVIKDCPPRISSISAVQPACVFSRSLILYRDNNMSCYCMMFCGFYALNSVEVFGSSAVS